MPGAWPHENQDTKEMLASTEGPTLGKIYRTWWPLAASWVLMAFELPSISAVMARLADPQIHLAAWGGVVFPVALIVEAPVIMLLAASTALSREHGTFRRVRGYMMWAGAILTGLHVLIAFTPLFDLVVVKLMRPPAEIVEAARLGLRLMTPWTWSIGYRRFNQGVLIRFGHPEAVTVGTVIRLSADVAILGTGLVLRNVPGVVVAGCAVSAGVISEAVYSGLRLRPVLRDEMPRAESGRPIDLRSFLSFYAPLAMTSLMMMLTLPLGSAAASRMPRPLDSLAAWPALAGIVFIFRSLGMAYNEVVVARLEQPGAYRNLLRFTVLLASGVTGALALIGATPLAGLWFAGISGLPPGLASLGRSALWASLPVPGLTVLQSWFQGALVHARRTRAVTEAIGLNLIVLLILFPVALSSLAESGERAFEFGPLALRSGAVNGLAVVWGAFAAGNAAQTAWLWWRSRGVMALARGSSERAPFAIPPAEVMGG